MFCEKCIGVEFIRPPPPLSPPPLPPPAFLK